MLRDNQPDLCVWDQKVQGPGIRWEFRKNVANTFNDTLKKKKKCMIF